MPPAPLSVMPTPQPINWKNARGFPRFAYSAAVTASGQRFPAPLAGKLADIGLGGVCAAFDKEQPTPGDRLHLEFRVPHSEEAIHVLAKVRYSHEGRCGLQFLNITPQQREQIRRACVDLPVV